MPADVTGDFSTAGRVAYVDGILQVQFFSKGGKIVGVGIHIVAVPGLGGTAVPAAVMGDNSKTMLAEEQHLSVPVVCAEGPAVAEDDRLSFAPILVIDGGAVFGGNCGHSALLRSELRVGSALWRKTEGKSLAICDDNRVWWALVVLRRAECHNSTFIVTSREGCVSFPGWSMFGSRSLF